MNRTGFRLRFDFPVFEGQCPVGSRLFRVDGTGKEHADTGAPAKKNDLCFQ
jgi:hypothetical protein